MADKKISELPILGYYGGQPQGDITASGVGLYPQNIVPVVVGGTTYQISLQNFTKYVTQYNATTGSNAFIGNQTIQGNVTATGDVTVQGKLTAQEVHTEITSASIIFESGSTIFGNSVDDTHQFTGIVSINGASINNQADRIHQATASLQQFTASQDQRNLVISEFTSSTDAQLRRVYQTTSSLNIFTGSQDSRNFVISQFTSSTDAHIVGVSTYTSSLEAQLRRVYQTTSSLNIFTGSQDSRNFVISQFTSSTDAHIVGIATYTSSLEAQLRRVYQTTSSLNIFTGSQDSRNFVISQFTASTDNHILGISIYTASINNSIVNASAVTASIFAQLERVYQTTSSLNIFTGSQDSRNFVLSQFTSSTNNSIVGVSAFTSSQLAVNLGTSVVTRSLNDFTASARIELNSIEAYTASLKNAITVSGTNVQIIGDLNVNKLNVQYVSSSILITSGSNIFGDQSTDKHEFTGSVNLQNGLFVEDYSKFGKSGLAKALDVFGNIAVTGSVLTQQNTIGGFVGSYYLQWDSFGSQGGDAQASVGYYVGASNDDRKLRITSDRDIQLNHGNGVGRKIQIPRTGIGLGSVVELTGSLNITGSSAIVGNVVVTSGGITGSLLATNGVLSGSAQISELTQIPGIMALTASMKAAAIVSSSQQIIDYNTFAVTSSANTFYGTQTISGSLRVTAPIRTNIISGGLDVNGGITGSVKGNLDGVAAYASTVAVANTGTTTDTTLFPIFSLSPVLGSYTNFYSHASSSFFFNGVTRRLHMEGFVVSGSNNIAEISGSFNVSGSTVQIGNNTLTGNTILSGSVDISGSTTFTGAHIIKGTTQLSGSIHVSGSSNFQNSLFIVTGSAYFTGSHNVIGNSTFSGSINIASGSSYYRAGNKLFNYGQWASLERQTGSADTAYAVKLGTPLDGREGVYIANNGSGFPTRITVENTGLYNIQFSLQLNTTATETCDFSVWMSMTGSNIANSNTDFSINKTAGGGNGVSALNYLTPITANDYVELYWSKTTANGELQYKASQGTPTRPATPSAIVTITQVA